MKTVLLLISIFLMTFVVSAQTKFWNHPEGGDWSDASLWSDATVPTADDDVHITGVITITTDAVAKSVVTGDATQINISFDGKLTINGSEGAAIAMGDRSSLSIFGQLMIGNFDFVGSGIVANAGADITIDGNGTLSIAAVLTGDAINLRKDGNLTNYSSLEIKNISNGGGLCGTNIVNQGNISIEAINGGGDAITLAGDTLSNDNNGTITISLMSGSAITTNSFAAINNIGSIYINDVYNSARPAIQLSGGTKFDNINMLMINNTAGTALLMNNAILTNKGVGRLLIFGTGGDGIVMDNESQLINHENIQLGTIDEVAVNGKGIVVKSGSTFRNEASGFLTLSWIAGDGIFLQNNSSAENYGTIKVNKVDGIVLLLESSVFDNYGTLDGASARDLITATISITAGSQFTNQRDAFVFTGIATGPNFHISDPGTLFLNQGQLFPIGAKDIVVVENNGKMSNDATGGMNISTTQKNGLVVTSNGEFLNNGYLKFEYITGEAIFISNARFNNNGWIDFDNILVDQQQRSTALLHIEPGGRFNNQAKGTLNMIKCPGDAIVFHASAIDTGFVNSNHGLVQFGNIGERGLYNAAADASYPISNYGRFEVNGFMSLYASVVNEPGSKLTIANGSIVTNNFPFINKDTITNNGTWNANAAVTNNGLYKGTGTFKNSAFINNGIVAPGNSAGCTSFENGYISQPNSSLSIEVNGKATACVDFDRVNVTGGAALEGGTLSITFGAGYTPATNDMITIFKSTSLNGTFTNNPPAGWTVLYNTPENGDITLKKIDVLPLTLLIFDVKADGSTAKTTWKTSDEINTSHFELERSKDGISFTKLETIPAMNTGGDHHYSFTDLEPMNGRNNYRLRMVDIDGSYTNSKIVAVDMNKPASSQITSIYPNPVQDVVNIKVATNDRLTVELVAPDGRRILTKSIGSQGVHTINVSGLAPGLYFLKVSNGEVYRLMKE